MKGDGNIARDVGKEEAMETGRKEGREATLIASLRRLLKAMKRSRTKAMDPLEVPPAMRKEISPPL